MKTYIRYISQLAKNLINKDFANSDEEHAIEVLVRIFEQSKKNIRIFAQSLCSDVPNNPRYIVALSDFIERDGTVEIIVNKYNENMVSQSNLFKRLSFYLSQGKYIKVYRTDAVPYLSNDPDKKEIHFTIGDELSYRIETDIEKRTAVCNFNNPNRAKILVDFFNRIKKNAIEEDIQKVFSK